LAGSRSKIFASGNYKFFAQKILHKIPSFWDFTFVFFNKRLSAHHFFLPKTVMRNFDKNGDVHLTVY